MSRYTVRISERPLGVRFAHFHNNKHEMVAGLHQVLVDSYGYKLGLSAGDTLIAVNDESVSHLSSSKALQSFRSQSLPFTASFERYKEISPLPSPYTDQTESDDDEDSVWMSYINSNSTTNSNNTIRKIQDMHYNYTSDADEASISTSNSDNSLIPSDCDTDSECSISFDVVGDSNELSYHNISDTVVVKPFYELAQKLLLPKIQLPLKQYSSLSDTLLTTHSAATHHFDFIYLDDNDKDKEDGIHQLLYKEYDEMDIDTKDLVNGYLRCLLSNITDDTGTDIIHLLTAKYLYNNSVIFDRRSEKISDDAENIKVSTTSRNGFYYGIHEWSIKILKCDVYRQEIGVIENNKDLQDIEIQKGGIPETSAFGARAVYGNQLFSNQHYYASYNNNNNIRCKKAINTKIGWCQGDIIRTVLNLKRGNIQFYLNGKKVRKTMSLQKGIIYHPIIAFSGNCQYELINYL